MERPQHPVLFDQAIKDCACLHFGEGTLLEGYDLAEAVSATLAIHEAWITGTPLVEPAGNAPLEDRIAYSCAAQLRQRFEAEPMMFGTPDE